MRSTARYAREDTNWIRHVDLERIIYTGTQRADEHPHVLISNIGVCVLVFVCMFGYVYVQALLCIRCTSSHTGHTMMDSQQYFMSQRRTMEDVPAVEYFR